MTTKQTGAGAVTPDAGISKAPEGASEVMRLSRSNAVSVKPFGILREVVGGDSPAYLAEVEPTVEPVTEKALEAEMQVYLELWRVLRKVMGVSHAVTLKARRKFRERRRQFSQRREVRR